MPSVETDGPLPGNGSQRTWLTTTKAAPCRSLRRFICCDSRPSSRDRSPMSLQVSVVCSGFHPSFELGKNNIVTEANVRISRRKRQWEGDECVRACVRVCARARARAFTW